MPKKVRSRQVEAEAMTWDGSDQGAAAIIIFLKDRGVEDLEYRGQARRTKNLEPHIVFWANARSDGSHHTSDRMVMSDGDSVVYFDERFAVYDAPVYEEKWAEVAVMADPEHRVDRTSETPNAEWNINRRIQVALEMYCFDVSKRSAVYGGYHYVGILSEDGEKGKSIVVAVQTIETSPDVKPTDG